MKFCFFVIPEIDKNKTQANQQWKAKVEVNIEMDKLAPERMIIAYHIFNNGEQAGIGNGQNNGGKKKDDSVFGF